MTRPLIVFGTGSIAELAAFYFERDSPYEIVAFTVDDDYAVEDSFLGRPLVSFSALAQTYDPAQHSAFVALSYKSMNSLRRQRFEAMKGLGFTTASYVSSRAAVLNDNRIGENCFILENVTIQPFVTIGDNVTIWCGVNVCHHSTIGSHSFLAPGVTISGDVVVGESCFIGVNTTIRNGVRIGDRCVLGAGSIILSDVESSGVYAAQPTPRSPSSTLRGS